jgi:hypothetical protein
LQRTCRFLLVARLDNAMPLRFERMPEHRAQGVLVLDEQNRRVGVFGGS